MAESIKISELGELVSGSVVGTTKIPVVNGGDTLYTQASSLKAYVNSDVATDAELAAQISVVNSTIDGLTTADISENASFLYYTDTRVTNRLNALSVLSGSSTSLIVSDGDTNVNAVDKITFNNATVFNAGSGDVTVTVDVPATLSVIDTVGPTVVNNVDQITFSGATVTNNGSGDITVTITPTSTNISALNSFTSSMNSFTGSIRGEVSGIEAYTSSLKAVSIVSSSQQITNLGFATTSSLISSGLISSSQQISDFGFITEAGGTIPQGTVSSSQQIVGLGFVTTGSLATGPNFHIISQSIIATDPIDSNLLLSSVYVDKTRTITFSQFSQSLDSRIAAGGGVGSTDYVSNVTFGNNTLTFTGVGSAFNSSVTLTNGIVSSSNQITDLGYLTATDVNQTYINNRLPIGLVSSSAQISNLGFATTSSLIGNGFISSSAQITLTNSNTGGFDTSYVAENINYKYYTDARVETVINGLGLVSGSFGLPSGSVSSSSQIDYQLVFNKVLFYTGSNNLTITSGSQAGALAYGSPWVSIAVNSPSNTEFSSVVSSISSSFDTNLFSKTIISGSTQISNLGFVNNESLAALNAWTGSIGGFGVVSSSLASRIVDLSNVVLTASAQIDYDFIQNTPTFAPGDGILISQSLENAITITSNASAPIWDSITFKPNDLVSSSIQVDGYHLFAKTGSTNTFYGNQTVYGEVQSTDLTVTGISDFQGAATFGQNVDVVGSSLFSGPVSNNVYPITVSGTTASLDFSTGNLFEIELDPSATTHISASNISIGQTVTVLITTANESTASFSNNIRQPFGSFYTASDVGSIDIITLTSFGQSIVYMNSIKNNFV